MTDEQLQEIEARVLPMLTPRPYQEQGIAEIRAAIADGCQDVLYALSTGGGKTVMFCYMAAAAAAMGTRTCIIVHRNELIKQASRSLEALGIEHGVISAQYNQTSKYALIQVASIHTLVRRTGYDFDFLIFDEAHHCTSDTWRTVRARHPEAVALGVTATPCRLSGRGLGTIFERLIVGPSMTELIAGGFLVPAKVYAPQTLDLSCLRVRGGDYLKEQLSDLMDRREITGCAVQHYRRLCDGYPAVAFCVSVAHAEHVAAQFRAEGYRAASIDGGMPQEERDRLIGDLGGGRLNVLTSCDLISEGVDIPVVTAAILLRPTKSTSLYMQQVGRVLRPSPGKAHAIILDHVGNVWRHNLPDVDRQWSLDEGVEKGPREAIETKIKQCGLCYFIHPPAPVCPKCGYEYPAPPQREVEQVDGSLKEVTDAERAELIRNAKTLDDFHRLAKGLGYKAGWAWHQYKRRQAGSKLERARVGNG